MLATCCSLKSCVNTLTPDVREAVKFFLPTVWVSVGVFLVFIQAGFAVDSPTACHLVGNLGHKKADLTHQFVWWCVHKLVVIPASVGSIGSHQLHLKTMAFISFKQCSYFTTYYKAVEIVLYCMQV